MSVKLFLYSYETVHQVIRGRHWYSSYSCEWHCPSSNSCQVSLAYDIVRPAVLAYGIVCQVKVIPVYDIVCQAIPVQLFYIIRKQNEI